MAYSIYLVMAENIAKLHGEQSQITYMKLWLQSPWSTTSSTWVIYSMYITPNEPYDYTL